MANATFSQVVHARPDEVSEHVGMLLHHLPILESFRGKRLSAHHDALRKACVVGLIFPPLVVVATNIERGKRRGRVSPGQPRFFPERANGRSDRAGGIQALDGCHQPFSNFHTRDLGALWDLVADAPKNYARVVAVATQHGLQIAIAVLLEV